MKKVFIALSLVAALSLGGCTSVTAQNKEFTSKVVGKVANEKIEITTRQACSRFAPREEASTNV